MVYGLGFWGKFYHRPGLRFAVCAFEGKSYHSLGCGLQFALFGNSLIAALHRPGLWFVGYAFGGGLTSNYDIIPCYMMSCLAVWDTVQLCILLHNIA